MEILNQVLPLIPPLGRITVLVSIHFPYKSIDPEKPGMVHAVIIEGVMLVSREAYDTIKQNCQ